MAAVVAVVAVAAAVAVVADATNPAVDKATQTLEATTAQGTTEISAQGTIERDC